MQQITRVSRRTKVAVVVKTIANNRHLGCPLFPSPCADKASHDRIYERRLCQKIMRASFISFLLDSFYLKNHIF
jgi:hypothetical protein